MKSFTAEDVPTEVWEVWAVQIAKVPVGLKHYDEMRAIMKKYPEWFPWETAYGEIPQKVHDAYFSEKMSIWEYNDGVGSKGLIPTIEEYPPINEQPYSIIDTLKHLFEAEKVRKGLEEAYQEAAKKLWDKHYSKYKLEYRP